MYTGSDSDNDSVVQELTTGHYEDGKLSDPEQDTSVTDPDQPSTEEHIPDMDTHTSNTEDNPFAAPNNSRGQSECDSTYR